MNRILLLLLAIVIVLGLSLGAGLAAWQQSAAGEGPNANGQPSVHIVQLSALAHETHFCQLAG